MFTLSTLLAFLIASAPSDEVGEWVTAVHDSSVFSCSPLTISPGEKLVLRKSSAMHDELSVLRPGDDVPHFLVVGSPPRNMRPLMTPKELAKATEVRISVDSLTGLPWRAGASQERVFTVSGKYEIHISTALESEEGSYYCTVSFSGTSPER